MPKDSTLLCTMVYSAVHSLILMEDSSTRACITVARGLGTAASMCWRSPSMAPPLARRFNNGTRPQSQRILCGNSRCPPHRRPDVAHAATHSSRQYRWISLGRAAISLRLDLLGVRSPSTVAMACHIVGVNAIEARTRGTCIDTTIVRSVATSCARQMDPSVG